MQETVSRRCWHHSNGGKQNFLEKESRMLPRRQMLTDRMRHGKGEGMRESVEKERTHRVIPES